MGLFAPIALHAQTIEITFSGTYQGSAIALDSIFVENLTQGGDTLLHYPDTVLVLAIGTGIGQLNGNGPFTLRPNSPNPYTDHTTVHLHVAKGGPVTVGAQDALGRELARYTSTLAPGLHTFTFHGGAPGVNLLWADMHQTRRSIRMVRAAGQSAAQATLTHAGIADHTTMTKGARSLFTWNAGDELAYTGYATIDGNVAQAMLQSTPEASETHVFVFAGAAACPAVTDIDGNVYATVQIGEQCWMAENLKTTRYSDGSDIPNVTGNAAWAQLNTGAWCNYDNNAVNDAIYGKLYNWYAVDDTRGLCPQGWHVPTDAEWQEMESALDMPAGELNSVGFRGAAQNVGGKMKATTLWNAPNTGATNESGFSALPGGARDYGAIFYDLGDFGHWWSTSENSVGYVVDRRLYSGDAGIFRGIANDDRHGICVRCLRD